MSAVTVTETIGEITVKTEFESFEYYERSLELTGGAVKPPKEVSLMGGAVKPPKEKDGSS